LKKLAICPNTHILFCLNIPECSRLLPEDLRPAGGVRRGRAEGDVQQREVHAVHDGRAHAHHVHEREQRRGGDDDGAEGEEAVPGGEAAGPGAGAHAPGRARGQEQAPDLPDRAPGVRAGAGARREARGQARRPRRRQGERKRLLL